MTPAPAEAGHSAGTRPTLPRLLFDFLKIGSIGFGGGMAVIALMEREFVRRRKLLATDEFVHGVGLGQILGSFAVNASFFIGHRLYGAVGGGLSAAAFLLPSLALVTALSHIYFRYHSIPSMQGAVAGLGPVVLALIVHAAWSLGRRALRSPSAVILAAAALIAGTLKINAVWILLAAGAVGYFLPNRPKGLGFPEAVKDKPGTPPEISALAAIPPALAIPASLWPLAATFFKIGLVFFGGGFVLLPLLHDRLVTGLHWLDPQEFLDGVAISNLTPGPIAVLATFAGYHVGGVAGALIASVTLFAPGIALMFFLSRQYETYRDDHRVRRFLAGMNPAVTGLVLSAAALLARSAITSWRGAVFCVASLVFLGRLRFHPAFVLAIGAVAGYLGALP